MRKPIVLVIHGMGTHKPGELKKQITEGLNEAAENFGLENYAIENKVEFFQFNYSVFLDEIREKDRSQANSISKHLSLLKGYGLGEQAASILTSFFNDLGDDEMLYTHWMDVVYYGLMFWGEKIRVDCAKKINDLMIESNLANRDVHIIAHSLGSAVLHDTLAKLFRNDVDITSHIPGLDIQKFKIKSIWTVANISRLLYVLNDIADPNHSIVHAGDHGCCDYMVNVRNMFDPFTWVKQYNREEGNSKLLEVNTVRQKNTHDIKEYMTTPLVSSYFLNYVLGTELSDNQWEAGVSEHAKTTINKPFDELKASFEDLSSQPDTSDKFEALKLFFSSAKEFKNRAERVIEE